MIRCDNLFVPLPAEGAPRNGSPRLSFRARHSSGRGHRQASSAPARAGAGSGQPHASKANSFSCFFFFPSGCLLISFMRHGRLSLTSDGEAAPDLASRDARPHCFCGEERSERE